VTLAQSGSRARQVPGSRHAGRMPLKVDLPRGRAIHSLSAAELKAQAICDHLLVPPQAPASTALPRLFVEQRAVEPDIFVTGGDEEPGAWRQGQVLSYLWAALKQVPCMPGLEEVVIAGHLARPDMPAGCLLYWPMAQPVDRPVPLPSMSARQTPTMGSCSSSSMAMSMAARRLLATSAAGPAARASAGRGGSALQEIVPTLP